MHKHAAANVAQRNRLNGKQQIPCAKPVNRPILSLNRKPKSRVESALNPIDLTALAEYHEQIESNLQRIERKNQRTWYSKPRSEMGVTCVGRQKMKLGSKPLI